MSTTSQPDMQVTFPERNWKRPNNVSSFPNTWHIFQVRDKLCKTYKKKRIQDMKPDQREEIWDIHLKHYCLDEELHRQTKMIEDKESMKSKELFLNHIMEQNLSLVAVLDDDNIDTKPSIIGYLLLCVVSEQDSRPPKLPGVTLTKLVKFIHSLEGGIDPFKELNSNYLLRDFGLVVKREYRGLNIGTELFKTIERIGKIFHIPAAVTTVTVRSSQILAARLGLTLFKEMKLIEYKDEEGRILFPESDTAVVQYGYFKFNENNTNSFVNLSE